MDCAPLNLAHFHERRAEKLIKRHRYEEAFKAIETSLLYVDDAYKNVIIQKSLEVLNTQKWDYIRKLNQIRMRKIQYEQMKSKEILPSGQCGEVTVNVKTDVMNAQSISRSIDKTIKEFNDKYSTLENIHRKIEFEENENSDPNKASKAFAANDNSKKMEMKKCRRLSVMNTQVQTDDDFPSLIPLELPSFDYTVFDVPPTALAENCPK